MKKQLLALVATGTMLFACNNKPADKVEDKKETNTEVKKDSLAPMDSAAAAKAWEEFMTPNAIHKMMASWDGNWEADVTHWMDPKAPPMKSKSTATNSMILGGRYQQTDFKGEMMGMPFEGRGILGYDNGRKIFTNTWIDNMGTGITTMEGSWDETTKSLSLKGKSTDPMTKQSVDMREVYTVVDDNTHKMEMYMPTPDGKEFKGMEIVFRRKK
jgi:hypothetical protein